MKNIGMLIIIGLVAWILLKRQKQAQATQVAAKILQAAPTVQEAKEAIEQLSSGLSDVEKTAIAKTIYERTMESGEKVTWAVAVDPSAPYTGEYVLAGPSGTTPVRKDYYDAVVAFYGPGGPYAQVLTSYGIDYNIG